MPKFNALDSATMGFLKLNRKQFKSFTHIKVTKVKF